jgi:hypothetical protein
MSSPIGTKVKTFRVGDILYEKDKWVHIVWKVEIEEGRIWCYSFTPDTHRWYGPPPHYSGGWISTQTAENSILIGNALRNDQRLRKKIPKPETDMLV